MVTLGLMMSHRKNSPAAQRFADRRQREEEAGRLSSRVPDLQKLDLEVEERCGVGGTKHIRRVMVERAPALFLVPCGDPRCVDGGHDITLTVLRALREREATFDGTDECQGTIGSSPCLRVLHFDGTAEYRT
jgi:hypothetical protein